MTKPKTRLLHWLRDAHAMEEQAVTMLNAEIRRLSDHPEIKAQLERHLAQSEHQRERLEACIERHNGGASAVKDTMAKLTGLGQAMSGLVVGDEVVKACLALYTFEHLEIGSYRILVRTAEAMGDEETKQVCLDILREEEAMAAWLEERLGSVTADYLAGELAEENR